MGTKNKSKRSKTKARSNDLHNISRPKLSSSKTCSLSPRKKRLRRILVLELNDFVALNNGQKGLIRYIGTVHFGKGEWFGIELTDGSVGRHDGKVGNQRYFKTAS